MLASDLDLSSLAAAYQSARPFPSICIDGLLAPDALAEVCEAYPSWKEARAHGRAFSAINESGKVQVSNPDHFPPALQRLSAALNSPELIRALEQMSGISGLLWDERFVGGGMHLTQSSGWLDVHADFNYIIDRQLHRRLNLLLYLSPEWDPAWGGELELWNADVTECVQTITPKANRCVIFSTSRTSFHGVRPVRCPSGISRNSFAVYYYTRTAPAGWDGKFHDTAFRARPDEHTKRVLMVGTHLKRRVAETYFNAKSKLRRSP